MIFTWPWALLSALALPALFAIYWLRRRARPRQVPSLLLWSAVDPKQASGRRWQRLQSSWLLLLEAVILALLCLAAAGPLWTTQTTQRPLYVVLDDSFSMQAGGTSSARSRAASQLDELLREPRHGEVHWILAGQRPRLLSQREVGESRSLPAAWRCLAPRSELSQAMALAAELGGRDARYLVVSDTSPDDDVLAEGWRWWALGRERSNLAIVQASRGPRSTASGVPGQEDEVLIEIANFSTAPASTTWSQFALPLTAASTAPSTGPASSAAVTARTLELAPGETYRGRFVVPSDRPWVVELAADSLEIDNRVVLLPLDRKAVAVALEIQDAELRGLLQRTLQATGDSKWGTLVDDQTADLVLTDQSDSENGPRDAEGPWRFAIQSASSGKARPFVGPYVVDQRHPLVEGLALDGVIWGAAPEALTLTRGNRAVISAGSQVLLTEQPSDGSARSFTMNWQPVLSNLQRTPNWPILWWNLVDWRRRELPGIQPINGRLGEPAAWRFLAADSAEAVLTLPSGSERQVPASGFALDGLEVGVHRLKVAAKTGDFVVEFAVNATVADESDLRRSAEQRLGDWPPSFEEVQTRQNLTSALILAAIVLLFGHLLLTTGKP